MVLTPGGGHLGERLRRRLPRAPGRGCRSPPAPGWPRSRNGGNGARRFAVFRRHHEFMAGVAADGAALRLDRQVTEPGTLEDAAIGRVHLLVAPVEGLQRDVETVGVLHEEFAGAEHAEPRPLLVAKLRLHLVERQGHLPIARQAAGNQLGDDLLVRRAQGHPHLAVLPLHGKLDEHLPERLQPARLLPQGDGRQAGISSSTAPARSISSRTICSALRSDRRPRGR